MVSNQRSIEDESILMDEVNENLPPTQATIIVGATILSG